MWANGLFDLSVRLPLHPFFFMYLVIYRIIYLFFRLPSSEKNKAERIQILCIGIRNIERFLLSKTTVVWIIAVKKLRKLLRFIQDSVRYVRLTKSLS